MNLFLFLTKKNLSFSRKVMIYLFVVFHTTLVIPTALYGQCSVSSGSGVFLSACSGLQTASNTLANFTVPAGNNRLLVVTASDPENCTDITTVTFNGTAMTQQVEKTDGFAVDAIFTLTLGSSVSSTTGNIVIASNGTLNSGKVISANVFYNVNQSAPVGSPLTAQNTTIPSVSSLNVTTTTGDMVFDIFDTYKGTTGSPQTAGSGQTTLSTVTALPLVIGFGYYKTSVKPAPSGGVITTSWSTTNHEALIHLAIAIKAISCTAPSITSSASSNSPICSGGTLNLSVGASGTAPLSYTWTGTGTFTNGTTATPSVTGAATGNYVVTVSNSCGNVSSTAAVTVNQNVGTPSFSAGAATLCAGATSTYTATASNSTGITYSIVGSGASINPSTGQVSGVTGNFTVRATATGCNGPTTADFAVTVTPLVATPSYTSGATALCLGATSTYTATATNATGISYSIFTGGASINPSTGVVSNVTSNFTVRATATGTCNTTTADRSVTVNTPSATASISHSGGTIANPTAIAGNPTKNIQLTGCEGTPITLTATVGATSSYSWLKNGTDVAGSLNQATIPVTISWGDYQLVAYDINGCGTFTDTVGISLKKATANAGVDRNICPGSTTTLGGSATTGTTYTWTPSTNLSASNVASPTVLSSLTTNTTYSLVITKTFVEQEATFTCTSAPDDVNVTFKSQPAPPTIARTSASDIACQGSSGIVLTASNVVGTIQWYRGSAVGPTSNPITELSTSGAPKIYTAKNLNNGCYSVASNSVTITVFNAPVPTVASSVGALQSGSSTQFNLCTGITSAVLTASSATSANTATPTYAWYNPVISSTTTIGTGNTLAVTGITTTNQRRFVQATYVYPSLTCTANSLTMDIRQSALATGCRVMQNGQDEEVALENTLSVYPNPTSDKLTAQIQVLAAGEAKLSLVNGLGQIVWQEQHSLEAGKTDVTLSLAQLPAGIYHLLLDKEDMHQSMKVVKE